MATISPKFISGEIGQWHWEYRNKDGSRDKRVKSNYEQAGYTSNYECKKCGAKTMFKHFTSKKPSEKVKIWLRELFEVNPWIVSIKLSQKKKIRG